MMKYFSPVFILFLILAFVGCSSEPEIRKNVDFVEWLPGNASEISYYSRDGFGWFRFAEGTMAEENFRSFAASNGWDLEEKENVSVNMRSVLGEPPLREVQEGIEMDMVRDALVYEDRKPNGGGMTWVFDRETDRFYFNESHR